MVSNVVDVFTGTGLTSERKTIIYNYTKAIAEEPIFSSPLIQISYIGHAFLILSLLIILNHFFKKEFSTKKFIPLFWSFVIGIAGYAFAFLILYTFGGFSIDEGLELASYERYSSTFMMALYSIIILIIIDIIRQKNIKKISYKKMFLILATLSLIIKMNCLANFVPTTIKGIAATTINNYKEAGEKIKEVINDESARIYFVSDFFESAVYTRYYAENIRINDKYLIGKSFEDDTIEDIKTDFLEYLKTFNYIYVFDNYDYFNENFNCLFPNGQIEEGYLYKINIENNNINLVKMVKEEL